jgi:hypothetical protein
MPEIGEVRYEKVVNNGVVSVDRIEVVEVRQNFSIDFLERRKVEILAEKAEKQAEADKIEEIKIEAAKVGVTISDAKIDLVQP